MEPLMSNYDERALQAQLLCPHDKQHCKNVENAGGLNLEGPVEEIELPLEAC